MFKVSKEEQEQIRELCIAWKQLSEEVARLSEEQTESCRELDEYLKGDYRNV